MLEHCEGGCHCGRVHFRAQVDLDLLSQCSCTVCTKKGILHLPVAPENFELLCRVPSLTESQSTRAVSTMSTVRASSPLASSMAATGRKPSADGLPKEDTLPL